MVACCSLDSTQSIALLQETGVEVGVLTCFEIFVISPDGIERGSREEAGVLVSRDATEDEFPQRKRTHPVASRNVSLGYNDHVSTGIGERNALRNCCWR